MSIRPLSAALQKKAEEDLNEVPGRIKEDLEHLRNWLAKQNHLTTRTDDQWLLAFLRCCKYSLQKAKDKLDLFYTVKSLAPEIFTNRDPLLSNVQEYFRIGMIMLLPKEKDSTSPTVLLNINRDINPDIITTAIAGMGMTMALDYLLMNDDNLTISGLQLILDTKGMPFKYGIQLTPTILKTWITIFEKAYPIRPQGIHLINVPSFLEPIVNLAKKLTSEKVSSRIHIYTEKNIGELYKHIPQAILPTEYGGHAGPTQQYINEMVETMKGYRSWFLEDDQYGSDETKRPGKSITSADIFGIEGSFRKLEVD